MFPSSTKILVVDDMAMFRQMVKQALTEMGLKNYQEAPDGDAAWKLISSAHETRAPFQLIISDWTMPKMKGIDLLRKVRSSDWGKHLPFVLLTGEAEKEFIVEAIQSGVTQYIVKPFNRNTLEEKLKSAYIKAAANAKQHLEVI